MIRSIACALLIVSSVVPATAQTLEEQNKEIVGAFVEAINARAYDRLDELVAPSVVRHSQATPGVVVTSLGELKAFLNEDNAAVPDSRIVVERMIAEGNLVALWAGYSGTQTGPMGPFPPSDRRMDLDFAGFLRLENGKIGEMWVIWDNMAALTQLGHFPLSGVTPEREDEG